MENLSEKLQRLEDARRAQLPKPQMTPDKREIIFACLMENPFDPKHPNLTRRIALSDISKPLCETLKAMVHDGKSFTTDEVKAHMEAIDVDGMKAAILNN
jgi:hypothetical protein